MTPTSPSTAAGSVAAPAPTALCPYGCGATSTRGGYCSGCGARVRRCGACRTTGRALAAFCRGCGVRIEPCVDWSAWGGGAHGSGEWDGDPGAGEAVSEAKDVWATPYESASEVGSRAALVAGLGHLFFVDMTGRLHVISMAGGQGRVIAQGLVPDSTPALAGRQLVALAPDAVRVFEAHAPPAATPELTWVEKAASPIPAAMGSPVACPAVTAGIVVVALAHGEESASLVGLDRQGLAVRWHLGPFDGAPLGQSVRGGVVAWGATAGSLLVAGVAGGEVRAQVLVPEGLYWPPALPILCDREGTGRAIALDGAGALVILEPSGTLSRPGMIVEEPSALGISPQGIHVGQRGDATATLYDPHGRTRLLGPVRAGATGRADAVLPQMIVTGDAWILGTPSGMIGAISRLAGGLAWRIPVLFASGGQARSFVVVEGRAFALSETGEVRALALGPGGHGS